jgi:hypothetical protein
VALDVATARLGGVSLSDELRGGVCTQKIETSRTLSERTFDRLLIESVDESLATVLGEMVRNAVYDALENNFSIARNQIHERLNDFTLGLERSFGVTPSKVIAGVNDISDS